MRARFGFSDLVTALLPLGCTVLLYRGGEMPLEEYLTMGYDRDLLLGVRVPLDGIVSVAYESARNSETDLPVLTCCLLSTSRQTGKSAILFRVGKNTDFTAAGENTPGNGSGRRQPGGNRSLRK